MYNDSVDGKLEFLPEEIEKGKLNEALNLLMSLNCEIRLFTDSCCWILEYIQNYRAEDGTHFLLTEDAEENADFMVSNSCSGKNDLDKTTKDVLESIGNHEID